MDFFVQLAFDLNDRKSPQYESIKVRLSQIRMNPYIEHEGQQVRLPNNTYAGTPSGDNAEAAIERVREVFRQIAQFDSAAGTFFITASPKTATEFDAQLFNIQFVFQTPTDGYFI